jgi:hypothetical protein
LLHLRLRLFCLGVVCRGLCFRRCRVGGGGGGDGRCCRLHGRVLIRARPGVDIGVRAGILIIRVVLGAGGPGLVPTDGRIRVVVDGRLRQV